MDQKQSGSLNNTKQQVIDALKNANNVLITVSQSPSIDQLASCIGLALFLNKMNKHATAIFSGSIPTVIDYLQPDKLLEGNTDSLRDFIISLDRDKADKLRYKVEDNVVRIFITPYRTSINEGDLVFSQGDFNVDVVVALGVDQREHLDLAIMQQGRILHDAVVLGISTGPTPSNVGAINWHESTASSLCELIMNVSEALQGGLLDAQIANALLTGIVAETDRFRNEKTTAKVMTMSAQLIAAGANQQLVAEKLEIKPEVPSVPIATQPRTAETALPSPLASPVANDTFKVPQNGQTNSQESTISLHIDENPAPAVQLPGDASEEEIKKIKIDEQGFLHDDVPEQKNELNTTADAENNSDDTLIKQDTTPVTGYITEPPKFASTFTASENNPFLDQPSPLNNLPPPVPILSHKSPLDKASNNNEQETQQVDQDSARNAVLQAIANNPSSLPPTPIAALNAQPMDLNAPVSSQNTPPPLPPPISPISEPSMPGNQTSPPSGNPFNLPPATV